MLRAKIQAEIQDEVGEILRTEIRVARPEEVAAAHDLLWENRRPDHAFMRPHALRRVPGQCKAQAERQ
ncbi:hypothetical protein PF005_g16711 [Phytophthora fragariae]|uniref:Uncharacterized protein n=1 Tax=Phytophthora fragariae TaxID=53985 RepID=A0A6A3T4N4_9STRA|nr:hypothetical protein PF003_g4041 [Phytophthora fragariae]KAE8931952.1 hypothetical protein PF009_g18002 [Phytophthora fragariae]KAE8996388.1 hypothetical protein PF011_g15926 [Phytophthora fragariae]KAE9092396.1 hypothetical protein PF007_g18528 [Phytophthora fragariae]KAE9095895.1 hypothetical protein PF010_g16536 [Phytophthora fragariae]